MGNIKSFSKKISCIEEAIKNNLDKIDNESYHEKLEGFGYDYKIMTSTNLDDDENFLDVLFKSGKNTAKITGVYIFETVSNNMNKENWDKYKNDMKKNSKKVPKWNEGSNKDFFYIGKSNDLKKRIKEHTDTASPGTYALKLKEFKKCFSDFEYKVHIFYPKDLDQKNSSISNYRAINELVESVLHDSLKPMIGNK